jgi:hypothetical protein
VLANLRLGQGFDPTQDTPIDILHTFLIGLVKYIWHMLYMSWTPVQRDLFVLRLQSSLMDSLAGPPMRASYIMQYKNNLIGKHFKTLVQTIGFHLYGGLATKEQIQLVHSVGILGGVLWLTEINNESLVCDLVINSSFITDTSKSDLCNAVANVLDCFGAVDPERILEKSKLHLMCHVADDARRFGPMPRSSVETFECFNAVFRRCAILSNRRAISHDIASQFSRMGVVKHLLSGGFYRDTNNKWNQAGSGVSLLLRDDPVIQTHIGWSSSASKVPGLVIIFTHRYHY